MNALTWQLAHIRGLNANARLFLAHTIVFNLGLSIIVLLYNLYVLSLGFEQDAIGLINLTAAFTTVVASVPAGILVRHLGWQRAFFLSILGTAASIVISLVSPNMTGFIVTELVWGFFFAMLVLIGAPFMTENSTDAQRDPFFSLQFAVTMLAFTVGNLFGGRLTALFADLYSVASGSPSAYAGALWVSVALMLLSAFPFFFLRAGAREHRERIALLSPFGAVQNWRPVLRLSLIALLGGAAGGLFLPFVNVFWKLSFGLGDDRIGELFALSALIIASVTLLAPLLTAHWGRLRVIVIAQFLSIPTTLVFGLANVYAFALLGYFLRDAFYHMARPLLAAFQMEQVDAHERAVFASILSVVWNLAWGATSWLSGQWQVAGQIPRVFIITGIFQFASTLMLFLFFGRIPKTESKVTT